MELIVIGREREWVGEKGVPFWRSIVLLNEVGMEAILQILVDWQKKTKQKQTDYDSH